MKNLRTAAERQRGAIRNLADGRVEPPLGLCPANVGAVNIEARR